MNRIAALLLVALLPSAVLAQADPYHGRSGSWGQKYPDQWGLARVGLTAETAPGIWARATAGKAVIVAVIDTGLDYFHPDLRRDTVWRNPRETLNKADDDGNGLVDDAIGWDFWEDDNDPWDWTGHGTFVAGIIAAATGNGEGIAGVAPNVKIMPLRAMNIIGRGYPTRIARAVYYAVANGARVINLSVAASRLSPTERRAIDYAIGQGVTVVAAAGNEGKDASGFTPAAIPGVITVGAIGPDGQRAAFSNWGERVDLVAPGVDILSLRARQTDFLRVSGPADYRAGRNFLGPGNRYYRADGTSFAAPFVSGAVALLLSVRPELKPAEVKRVLTQSARDLGRPGVDADTAYGLLDVPAALAADPAVFVEAVIAGIAARQADGATVVRVSGTADADRFARAWIEIGAGEDPSEWKRVSREIASAVRGGVLDDLKAELFRGAPVWTLRLVVEHANGKRREARHILRLG